MPKYAKMLAGGMEKRGHEVEIWRPKAFFYKLPLPYKKWLGYLDQFVVFPLKVRRKLKDLPAKTLFVFSDHALGPWIPMVAKRPHVIHCHDFLAQRSGLGDFPENTLQLPGRIYQRWIRRGYKQGKNFISISEKTRVDLHRFLKFSPELSEVVYNGLNQDFKPGDQERAKEKLEQHWGINLKEGFILHVGGNQFYKNRTGVITIYKYWREKNHKKLPLIMLGARPSEKLVSLKKDSGYSSDIHFLTKASDEEVKLAYQAASVLLFPSLEEGFGWPIAEAMASGCPVITTQKAPMTEVGRNCCFYISRMPQNKLQNDSWAHESAFVLEKVIRLPKNERKKIIASGIKNARRFDTELSIEKIESIYKRVLKNWAHEYSASDSFYGSHSGRTLPGN